jgi:hypothetical protein
MSADIVAVRRKPVLIRRSFVPAKQPRLARIASANENYPAGWTLLYIYSVGWKYLDIIKETPIAKGLGIYSKWDI